jgi:hypothetical protein
MTLGKAAEKAANACPRAALSLWTHDAFCICIDNSFAAWLRALLASKRTFHGSEEAAAREQSDPG